MYIPDIILACALNFIFSLPEVVRVYIQFVLLSFSHFDCIREKFDAERGGKRIVEKVEEKCPNATYIACF